jgi:hypothetical protein
MAKRKRYHELYLTTNKNGLLSITIGGINSIALNFWSDERVNKHGANILYTKLNDGTERRIKIKHFNKNLTRLELQLNSIIGVIDLSNAKAITFFHVYSNPGLTKIIHPTSYAIFASYDASSCNLTGNLDISTLLNLGGVFQVAANPLLTSITNPPSAQVITSYSCFSCNLTGNLDLSPMTNLNGALLFHSNPLLTSITFSPATITTFLGYSCKLTGNLNLSLLTISGAFNVGANPFLTSITNSVNSGLFSYYGAAACSLTGNLDISMIDVVAFEVFQNPLLTSITNPVSAQVMTTYSAYSCNLTGTLDVSTLTGLGGGFLAYNNPLLTSITNPASAQVFNNYSAFSCDLGYIDFTTLPNMTNVNNAIIQLQGNSMTAEEVNHILVDLDTISNGLFTGRSINIAGTNAAPDAVSGGFDGSAAVTSLVAKGFTVTHT